MANFSLPEKIKRKGLWGNPSVDGKATESKGKNKQHREKERRTAGMINLEGTTKLSVEDVLERLKKFFGKGGEGLELKEDSPFCLTFSGGGGYVTATLCLEEGKTRVNLVSQEWERQAEKFLATL